MIEHLRNLIRYEEWADAHFLRAWEQTSDAANDKEMLQRWEHVTAVQNAFCNTLKGSEVTFSRHDEFPPILELKRRSQSIHDQLKKLLQEYTSEDLDQRVAIPWFPDPSITLTRMEAITQIVMHTQHHRAQNMTKLQTYGGKPGIVDWILWVFKGKPEAKW
jgi:uncharacterized damage-inducible protein DinB